MCDAIQAEISLKNFWFSHPHKELFCTSQWRWHPGIYLAFRIFVLTYSVAAYVAVITVSVVDAKDGAQNVMVYLTIWTFTVLTLHFLVALFIAVHHVLTSHNDNDQKCVLSQVKIQPYGEKLPKLKSFQEDLSCKVSSPDDVKIHNNNNFRLQMSLSTETGSSNGKHGTFETKEIKNTAVSCENGAGDPTNQADTLPKSKESCIDSMKWYLKLSWLLAGVSQHFCIIVSLVYWCVLFPSLGVQGYFVNDVNMHAINTVFAVMDMTVSARPVRFLHFVYPAAYGIIYVVFSVIYWSVDKKNHVVYSILDWNYPGVAAGVVVGLAVIAIPLIQLAYFGLYKLRLHIFHNIYHKQ